MRNRIRPNVTVLLLLLLPFAFASVPALATSTAVTFEALTTHTKSNCMSVVKAKKTTALPAP
ncbi:hypothetical protein [Xanthomonas axonopodis]